jgi:bifunctional non-homologous end joining protein LigD
MNRASATNVESSRRLTFFRSRQADIDTSMPHESPLSSYRSKRDQSRTPEPFGFEADLGLPAVRGQRFVIQQHAARRLHWDFRLEIDGVLVSWAVPRGPAVDPKVKRLAVRTEDHPLAYADFEGTIPPGNYGAGTVIVWDRGIYQTVDGSLPAEALQRGKLDFELYGHKLSGRWALIRTKGGKGNEWLLLSKSGRASKSEPVLAQPASIFSGLTVEELQRGVQRDADLAAAAARAGAVERRLAHRDLSPMLAETADEAFSRPGWLFEVKYDGVRAIVIREPQQQLRVLSRTQRDASASFPEIVLAARHLPCSAFVADGEIVAGDETGRPSFARLQQRLGAADAHSVARAAAAVPVTMYAFDLLAVAGHDLRSLPLRTRKELLARLVPRIGVIRFADHLEEDGSGLFAAAGKLGIEGIIAKRADSPYASGRRSRDWLKIKAVRSADLAVVGFLPGKGARSALGSLMLAWNQAGELVYAGNVGSGLDTTTIDALLPLLHASRRDTPAFRSPLVALDKKAVFLEPWLVAEVRFTEVLESGVLRHPVFVRLRDDKRIESCDPPPPPRAPVAPAPITPDSSPQRLQLTNLDKVFWPQEGYTKGDLLRYYEAVWPALEPYLRDRPLVLTRYPDGIEGKSFFQKNAPEFVPAWITTHRIDDTDYFICNDLSSLLYVINSGCIPLHIWSARRQSLDRPDWTILDLDPKGAPFSAVATVARAIHRLLAPLGVPHFVKTSGQDGLHVLIPLGARYGHDEARMLAELLARLVAGELPDIATVARPLGERGGKVYIDFLQNGFGKTIAAPFSVRPRPGAPVSAWLEWREVTTRLDPARFTIRTLPPALIRRAGPGLALVAADLDMRSLLVALERRLQQ